MKEYFDAELDCTGICVDCSVPVRGLPVLRCFGAGDLVSLRGDGNGEDLCVLFQPELIFTCTCGRCIGAHRFCGSNFR